jgi:hypothetical protein
MVPSRVPHANTGKSGGRTVRMSPVKRVGRLLQARYAVPRHAAGFQVPGRFRRAIGRQIESLRVAYGGPRRGLFVATQGQRKSRGRHRGCKGVGVVLGTFCRSVPVGGPAAIKRVQLH